MSQQHTFDAHHRARRLARWTLGAATLLGASLALAEPVLKTIEECVETGTTVVNLPASAGGSLSAAPCSGCPTLRLRFDAKTRYFIGKEQVSYTRFRESAAKGDLRLDLFYEPKTRTLSRLRIPAVGRVK